VTSQTGSQLLKQPSGRQNYFLLAAKPPVKRLSVPVMSNQFFLQAFSYPKPYIIICAFGFYVTHPAHFFLPNFPSLQKGWEAGKLGSWKAGSLKRRQEDLKPFSAFLLPNFAASYLLSF